MTETVLVLPLVLLILALLLFFGKEFVRLQRASVMDRYVAWQRVAGAPGPEAVPQSDGWNTEQLNEAFFSGRAESIEPRFERRFPPEPAERVSDAVRGASAEAGRFVEWAYEVLPSGQAVSFTTTHVADTPIVRRLGGPIRHEHVRLDNEWKFVNGLRYDRTLGAWTPAPPHVAIHPVVRDEYLAQFDQRLAPLAGGRNRLAESLRAAYLDPPTYRGPELPADW